MKSIKEFAFGAFYLVSGIYSFGFSLFISEQMSPVSGMTAVIPHPDGAFPYEVLLFAGFGLMFLGAAAFKFRESYRALPALLSSGSPIAVTKTLSD